MPELKTTDHRHMHTHRHTCTHTHTHCATWSRDWKHIYSTVGHAHTHLPQSAHCEMCLCLCDTAWSIPCCVVDSDSITVDGPLPAMAAPLWEVGNDSTGSWSEESEPAQIQQWVIQNEAVFWFTCMLNWVMSTFKTGLLTKGISPSTSS